MGFSLKKTLIGGIAAAAIATTVVTTSISASNANTITISPSKTTVQPGETFDVMVGYEPGSDGIAAFTIDLHYDNTKLEIYEPTADELEEKYNVSTKFSYVSFNYTYSESVVRITGYSINNVKTKSNLALVTFKAKSNAKDSAGFWVEVDTMTTVDTDGSLKDAAYSVPTKTSMVKLPIKTQSAVVTTTTKATTTTPPSTTTTVNTQASANNPVTTTTPKPVTTTTTTATPKPTTTTTTTQATTTTTSQPVVTTSPTTTTETPVVTTTTPSVEAPQQTTTTTVQNAAPEVEETPSQPVFEYTYDGEGDFTETDEANFNFNLGDYVDDFSKKYDITLSVKATGGVNGAIGFNDSEGSWTTENFRFTEAGESQWTVSDVTLNENDALVYVPIYYMSNGATFEITAISIVDSETDEVVDDTVIDNNDSTDKENNKTEENLPEADNDADVKSDEEIADEDEDLLPDISDENPDTTGSFPVWLLIAMPVLMIAGAVASVVKMRKKIK